MPSRLRRRAVRRLVRRHRRQPVRPGIRPVAAATALVIVCAATIQLGVIAPTSISTTSAGPATVPLGPSGRVARVVAGAGGLIAGAVRWTVARTNTLPGGDSTCATEMLTRRSASVASLGLACTDGVSTAAHEAWMRLHEAESREARILRADRAEKRAAERRAEQRAKARQAEKRKAARARAEKRAAEKRAAEKRAAERRAARKAAERRAARKAAERRAARKAAANAASKARRDGASWRTAPIVTWYGPGFYGNRTACGVRYTRQIVGVAHRSLPCGTLVEFKWHGITAVAPVIDRGPFASSAYVFDFSAAMACEVFKPRGVDNACFTRYDVKYRVVGRVNLRDHIRRE